MQDTNAINFPNRHRELGVFFRDQRWMHMHHVLRSQGITFHELGHQGHKAALAILEAEGYTRKEASSKLSHRGRDGALASLEAQGFTGEGAASTSLELGCHGSKGYSEIYRTSGNCKILDALMQLEPVSIAKLTSPSNQSSLRKAISAGVAGGFLG